MNRRYRRLSAEQAELHDRLEAAELDVEQLRTTLVAVAREASGVTVGHTCPSCERCLVLVRRGRLYCPACGHGRTV